MSWIKKIMAFLNADDIEEMNQENTMKKTESKQLEKKSEKNEERKGDMSTRVTYQYPKGEFRFPVIPDKSSTEIQPKKVKSEVNKQQFREIQREVIQVELPKKKGLRPFKPAEIPSPIYGFGQRENEIEKEAVEHEAIEYELEHSFVQLEEMENKYVHEITAEDQELPIAEGLEATFVQNQLEEIEEPMEEIESIIIEQENISEEIIPVEEINKYTENMEDESNQAEVEEQQVKQDKSETRPKKQVPFNVLMLKNDREKYKKRSEQRKKLLAEEKQAEEKQAEEKQMENKKNINEVEVIPVENLQEAVEEDRVIEPKKVGYYEYPSIELLLPPTVREDNDEWLDEQVGLLNETLQNFNVSANVVKVSQGPSVTRFEVQPDPGVKVSRVKNLMDDIKLSMAAKDIRMEAPIPGKRSIGIEVPNNESRPVQISELIQSPLFEQYESPLTAVLGLDISGAPIITDLNKMPHGLIAGATGSGKSVCINSILISLLYKARPDEVKLLLIDPKMVELAPYNYIPHLISPVITDVKAATAALKWAVDEMERRYELFLHTSVRDINKYNELAEENQEWDKKLPYIVVVIDELADLMMMAPADVEESISRIAQKARACGIHLLIATQRPSVDVITGLIKANVPTRVSFSVSSQIDSRTIIDVGGAEKLLGRGDMLFLENGSNKPVRVQGTYVSDEEIDRVIEHVRKQGTPQYLFEQDELLKKTESQNSEDELFLEACEFIVQQGSASTSLLQRQFRIGYNRAARLMDDLEEKGIITEARGSRARDVLITEADLEELSV